MKILKKILKKIGDFSELTSTFSNFTDIYIIEITSMNDKFKLNRNNNEKDSQINRRRN
jgi:hypothetical protein